MIFEWHDGNQTRSGERVKLSVDIGNAEVVSQASGITDRLVGFPPRYAAVPFVACLLVRGWQLCRNAWALFFQFRPFWIYGSAMHRHARQISPGKNAMFPCTSAAFTLSAVSDGLRHEVPTRPQTRPSMQFLSVASHVCTPASSRQALAALPLPSASGYHRFMSNPCRYSVSAQPSHLVGS